MPVAAVSGAGGSSRDGLLLLIGERDLYCLPFSHIFTPTVLFQSSPFSLQYSLYSRTQGVVSLFWSTVFLYGNIGELFMFSFYTQTSGFTTWLLIKVLAYDGIDDGLIFDWNDFIFWICYLLSCLCHKEGEKADATIQKGVSSLSVIFTRLAPQSRFIIQLNHWGW